MTSKPAQRAARRRGELHRDGGDPRIQRAIAARHQLNGARLSMTLPHRPVRDSEVHGQATVRLEEALADREISSAQNDAAQGGPDQLTAAVALAEANEQVAAREAWLTYIEQ